MKTGIYKITNINNGKVYIGKSKNIKLRWKSHKQYLKNNLNSPNLHLQRAWNKYGKDNFIFQIIEECVIDQLKEKEEYWMNYYESYNSQKGYNKIKISYGTNILDEETKRKISEANSGENNYFYGKKFIFYGKENGFYGKQHNEETKRKISEANSGENSGAAKLTWNLINKIREEYKTTKTSFRKLAKKYNVGKTTIDNIINYKTWRNN